MMLTPNSKATFATILMCCAVAILMCVQAASARDKLVIISPHWEGIETEFERAFKAWYTSKTGREVIMDWIDQGGSSSDFRFIEAEFKRLPEGINIDLFFGGGIDNYLKLADKGLLHPYKLPEAQLKRIPKEIFGIPVYDAEYRWYGAALSTFGIMYNEELRGMLRLPEIKTWKDLTQPKLIGRVGAADPRESGSAHMMYEIILQGYGWEKGFELITQLGANVRGFSAGANTIPRDVASGQVIYGMAIDFYAFGQIAVIGEDKIKFIIPADAAVISPDSIAILKGAPNLDIAQKLLEFVLSDDGQKLWVLRDTDPEGPKWKGGLNRCSVIPALYDELGDRCVVTNPFRMDLNPIDYDPAKGGIRWDIVGDLIGALVIEPHKDLVDAWKTVNKCKDPQKREAAIQVLSQVSITEEEALALAVDKWKRPDYRNQKLKEWGEFARQKFKQAKKMVK
ncbi:MAG: extracellular solute-binding protein [Candidatus Poribacteria bacterium]|nr:extracellular solute-binding protein [Candidatus Poribacteria bacterium]